MRHGRWVGYHDHMQKPKPQAPLDPFLSTDSWWMDWPPQGKRWKGLACPSTQVSCHRMPQASGAVCGVPSGALLNLRSTSRPNSNTLCPCRLENYHRKPWNRLTLHPLTSLVPSVSLPFTTFSLWLSHSAGQWLIASGNTLCSSSTDSVLITDYGTGISLSQCKLNCESSASCADIGWAPQNSRCITFAACPNPTASNAWERHRYIRGTSCVSPQDNHARAAF